MFYTLLLCYLSFFFFFFNDTATTEIYTLSLHDALPIYLFLIVARGACQLPESQAEDLLCVANLAFHQFRTSFSHCLDRKSTRLNSSHGYISYAVFCLKKKKNNDTRHCTTSLHNICTSVD